MLLTKLRVDRLPGISYPFDVPATGGVNLIVGPNGSGKTSVFNAVFKLLWPTLIDGVPYSVRGDFTVGSDVLTAVCEDGQAPYWLRGGQTVAMPDLPDSHLAQRYQLGMLDLIRSDAGQVDSDLAQEIRKQMAGGYDLKETEGQLFVVGSQAYLKPRKELHAAKTMLKKVQQQQQRLSIQAAGLTQLEFELKNAQQAQQRMDLWQQLQTMAGHQAELVLVADRLGLFPAGVQKVQDNDPELVSELRANIRENEQQLASITDELEKVNNEIASLEFDSVDVESFDLKLVKSRVKELIEIQTRLALAEQSLAGKNGALKNARESSPDPDLQPVDSQVYQNLTRLLANHEKHRVNVEALENQLTDLAAGSVKEKSIGNWVTLGAGVVVLGVGLWLFLTTDIATPLGITAAAAALVGTLLIGIAGSGLFRSARLRKQGTGDQAIQKAQVKSESNKLDLVKTELKQLAEQHGLDLDPVQPDLLHALKSAALCQEAAQEQAEAAGELEGQRQQFESTLEQINTSLALVGHKPVTAADEADSVVETTADRINRLNSLKQTAEQQADKNGLLERSHNKAVDRLQELYQRLALDPQLHSDRDIAQLLQERPAYEAAQKSKATLELEIKHLERAISASDVATDDEKSRDYSPQDFAALIEQEKQQATQVEDLSVDIAKIKHEVQEAFTGSQLATAMDTESNAHQALFDTRERVQEATLASLLLGRVNTRHEQQTLPPRLLSARKYFSDFTASKYELQVVEEGDQGQFVAKDCDTEKFFKLGELSDGTRAQLLLAVRLAFITGSERTVLPPLFLDEALTASDPDRFAAIAGSLGLVAAEQNRQVFYLTCNPADVSAWQQALSNKGLPAPQIIDLGQIRKLAQSLTQVELTPLEQSPVPSCSGQSAAVYATVTMTPNLDPWAADSQVSPFYLLTDNLELYRNLLVAGVTTLGRWQARRDSLIDAGTVTAEQATTISARADLCGAVLEAWRIGRGRPVLPGDLESTRTLSSIMLPRVIEVLKKVDGNAALLITQLNDRAVQNLKSKIIDQLQNELKLAGNIDDRPCLEKNAVVAHVWQVIARHLQQGTLSADMARSLVLFLQKTLDA